MYRRQFIAGLMLATSPLAITHTVAQPAPAPGAIPAPMYLSMAAKGGMMLEETARDAFNKTQDPRVKKFSRAEVLEQVNLTDKLSANTPPGLMAGAAGGMAPGGGPAARRPLMGSDMGGDAVADIRGDARRRRVERLRGGHGNNGCPDERLA